MLSRQYRDQSFDVVFVDISVRRDSQESVAATKRNVVAETLGAKHVEVTAWHIERDDP